MADRQRFTCVLQILERIVGVEGLAARRRAGELRDRDVVAAGDELEKWPRRDEAVTSDAFATDDAFEQAGAATCIDAPTRGDRGQHIAE